MNNLLYLKNDLEHQENFITGFESILKNIELSGSDIFSETCGMEKYTFGVYLANGVNFDSNVGFEGFLGKGGDVFFKGIKRTFELIGDVLSTPFVLSSNLGFKAGLNFDITDPMTLASFSPLSDNEFLIAIRKPDETIKNETRHTEKYKKDNNIEKYARSQSLIAVAKAAKEKKSLAKNLEGISNLSSLIKSNIKNITIPSADMGPTERFKKIWVVDHKTMVGEFIRIMEKSKTFLDEKSYAIREVVSLKVDPDDIIRKAKKAYSSSSSSNLSDLVDFQDLSDKLKRDLDSLKAATKKVEGNRNSSKEEVEGVAAATKLLNILTQAMIPVEEHYEKLMEAHVKLVIRNSLLKLEIISRCAAV